MINRALFDMKHKNHVIASDWLAPGDRFVSVSYDNLIKIWSLENGRHLNDIDAGNKNFCFVLGIFFLRIFLENFLRIFGNFGEFFIL